MGYEDTITRIFLIAGHKNNCDGEFGHVKLHLKESNFLRSYDMMDVIEISLNTNVCVFSKNFFWFNSEKFPCKSVFCPLNISYNKASILYI